MTSSQQPNRWLLAREWRLIDTVAAALAVLGLGLLFLNRGSEQFWENVRHEAGFALLSIALALTVANAVVDGRRKQLDREKFKRFTAQSTEFLGRAIRIMEDPLAGNHKGSKIKSGHSRDDLRRRLRQTRRYLKDGVTMARLSHAYCADEDYGSFSELLEDLAAYYADNEAEIDRLLSMGVRNRSLESDYAQFAVLLGFETRRIIEAFGRLTALDS